MDGILHVSLDPLNFEGVLDNFQHALEVQRLPLVLALASMWSLEPVVGDLTFACVNVRSPTTGNSGCSVQFLMTSMVTSSFPIEERSLEPVVGSHFCMCESQIAHHW